MRSATYKTDNDVSYSEAMRSATPCGVRQQICTKYSLFIQIAFIFFGTNCFILKNIIVVSRVSLFLLGANPPVFSCSLPIRTLQLNYNISQGLCQ